MSAQARSRFGKLSIKQTKHGVEHACSDCLLAMKFGARLRKHLACLVWGAPLRSKEGLSKKHRAHTGLNDPFRIPRRLRESGMSGGRACAPRVERHPLTQRVERFSKIGNTFASTRTTKQYLHTHTEQISMYV